ncbi:MAG TPA: SRPBCC domain-containing protein [Thermoplasmata archaeon]
MMAKTGEQRGDEAHVTTRSTERVGTVAFDGEYATIAFERRLRHPVDVVWEALTESEHLARWYMTKAIIEARAGGRIEYWSGPAQVHVTGRILTWDPPRVFEHEWNATLRADLPDERSVVRWELEPDGEGTILRLTHRRLTRRTAIGFAPGVHAFLDRLEDQLDGVPLADWPARVEEVRAGYPSSGRWE